MDTPRILIACLQSCTTAGFKKWQMLGANLPDAPKLQVKCTAIYSARHIGGAGPQQSHGVETLQQS